MFLNLFILYKIIKLILLIKKIFFLSINFFFFGFFVSNTSHYLYLFSEETISNNININVFDVVVHFNYSLIILILILLIILILILFLLVQAKLLNISFFPNSKFDSEKYSPYECGFAPFKTERAQFDIKFYLVALLFLVFDVELMFLLPYCMSYYYLGLQGYLIFLLFFIILLVGFLIEWSAGMLTWKSDLINLKQTNSLLNQNLHENFIKFSEYQNNYLLRLDTTWYC